MRIIGSLLSTPRFFRLFSSIACSVLALVSILPCPADDLDGIRQPEPSSTSPVENYFSDWFARVSKTQAEQPHWITPVATVTPRLEEELRYDQSWETVPGGDTLKSFGGGKGLELIPAEHVELIFGVPAWQSEDTSPHKRGWTDESFLLKYRLLSANEEEGNYILTAFLGLSVPTGSADFTTHHYAVTPTVAFGKGWGDFDFQTTFGVSVPDDGSAPAGAGTPLLLNTAFQYRVMKNLWPEFEVNYTHWPNGKHDGLDQAFLTPGLVVGKIPIAGRVGLTFGAGYQIAVTDHPLYRHNFILTMRIPF
ncbi:MAG TPA: transporter [Candidatus Sulfopaludibacter sp.]|nr:transporter [Candidatus Sulfopaludibacter sp.]